MIYVKDRDKKAIVYVAPEIEDGPSRLLRQSQSASRVDIANVRYDALQPLIGGSVIQALHQIPQLQLSRCLPQKLQRTQTRAYSLNISRCQCWTSLSPDPTPAFACVLAREAAAHKQSITLLSRSSVMALMKPFTKSAAAAAETLELDSTPVRALNTYQMPFLDTLGN